MSKNKTTQTQASVRAFIDAVDHPTRKADAKVLNALMKRITGWAPKMWGPSIVGFGKYHYKYESGREGELCVIGFSPRKTAMTIYIMPGFSGYAGLLKRLGKHKTGKSCLYINTLADVDLDVLETLITSSVEAMRDKYDIA